MKISEFIRRREENRQAGKLKTVLESMLGPFRKRREGYTMETLRVGDETKTNPMDIHEILTENFREWFASPAQERHWDVQVTRDSFIQANSQLRVPPEVLAVVWDSLQPKARPDDTLAVTPSFEEFDAAIDHMGKDSAPGISGLSYNMMRVWSPEIRQRVYEDIVALWEEGR
jgi:hypothetical protein